jgi:hypothetical protein
MLKIWRRLDHTTPVAVDLWLKKNSAKQPDVFKHPQYIPLNEEATGLVNKPGLVWPEFDQSRGVDPKKPNSYLFRPYDDNETSPIGDYPRITPQFASLRDPFKYWDQQSRRNFGEILYDHDNFTDSWGIGVEMDPAHPRKALFKFTAFFATLVGLIVLWNPEKHAPWVLPSNAG